MYNRNLRFSAGLSCVLVVFMIVILTSQAQSQEKYPTKPIDIIVAFGPGGSSDVTARIWAEFLKKKWDVPINIINKPGGNTVPAGLEVYKSRPDGYTVLTDGLGASVLASVSMKSLPFEIMNRTFLGTYSYNPLVFIVPASSPYKSLKDLEIEVKKNPGSITWISMGGASNQDLGTRQFFKAIGVDILKTKPVIVKSGAEGIALAGGGHVVISSGGTGAVLPGISGGTVRALAITGEKRFPGLPDVPTTSELGFPTITSVNWNCISGPSNIPSHIVAKWEGAFEEILKNPDYIAKQMNAGAVTSYLNAGATKERIRREIEEVKGLWGVK
jgi:tripartite-type tricarboxylate transporter receptor subunit TctC